MDVIMFYDIDHGKTINDRPDNGWMPLNPEYPEPPQSGHWRVTTSLLGRYDCTDPAVQRQHLYWMRALGCCALTADFTNVRSIREAGNGPRMQPFYEGVYRAFEEQLRQICAITDFEAPKTYPSLRFNGGEIGNANVDDEVAEFNGNFKLILDDMYEMYQKYPEAWYKFDDGTDKKDKPFITIFAGWNLLSKWSKTGVPMDDDRFNIRWSNGFLMGGTTAPVPSEKFDGFMKIDKNTPYWLFVEHDQVKDGYYVPIYKEGADGEPEQMITWASVWIDGRKWDGLLDEIDGKLPIRRYTEPVYQAKPKALLLNRFNYPLAWAEEPQEGVSITGSTHIEPNVDWGFDFYDKVAYEMHKVSDQPMTPPPAPKFTVEGKTLKLDLAGYPTQYRVSNEKDFAGSEWQFVNVNDGAMQLQVDTDKPFYVQTKNSFGESQVAEGR